MAEGTPGCGPAHCALQASVQPGTGRPVSVARVRHPHERGLRGVWRRIRGRHRPSYRTDAVGRRLGLPRMPRGRFEGPRRPGRRGSGRYRCPRVRPARSSPASKIDDRSTRRAFTRGRYLNSSRSRSWALGDDVIGRLADVSPTLGRHCRKAAERWPLITDAEPIDIYRPGRDGAPDRQRRQRIREFERKLRSAESHRNDGERRRARV